MNSRKWQAGMVALVLLTLGLAAFAPFVWRFLRLKERAAAWMAVSVLVLEGLWFGLATVQATGTLAEANPAGLFGVVAVLVAVFGSIWMFRPYNKTEATADWQNF